MPRLALKVGSVALLTLVAGTTFWSLVPLALGLRSDVVMSGSMSPRIRPGDVVVSVPVRASQLRPGRIITFTDPAEPGRRLVHRYVAANADGTLRTKGDANVQADSTPVPVALVQGAAVVRIPFAGLPAYWGRTGQFLPLVSAVLVLLAMLAAATARPVVAGRHRRA